jgi:hypothetical protein
MELTKKWFAEDAPQNAKSATATLGTGDNGTITITYDIKGTEGNVYSVAVVVAEGANKAMSVALANKKITVTLGTGADSNVAASKNTATLIAAAISALDGFTATKSGTGGDSISEATSEDVAFEGGQFGTPCIVPYTYVADTSYYYVNIAPNTIRDANWRRFQLAEY